MPEFYLNEGHRNPGGEDKVIVDALKKIKYREAEDRGVFFNLDEILSADWSNPMEFHSVVDAIQQQMRTFARGSSTGEASEGTIRLQQNLEAAKILLDSFSVNVENSTLTVNDKTYTIPSPALSERDLKMWELTKRFMANQDIDPAQIQQKEFETLHSNLYKLSRVEILLAEAIAKAQIELGLE